MSGMVGFSAPTYPKARLQRSKVGRPSMGIFLPPKIQTCGARQFGWVGCFLQSVSYMKSVPAHEKKKCSGKKVAQVPLFNLFFFVGLSWPWVGEFVGFIVTFLCIPTQQNLVNRIHLEWIRDRVRANAGVKALRSKTKRLLLQSTVVRGISILPFQGQITRI